MQQCLSWPSYICWGSQAPNIHVTRALVRGYWFIRRNHLKSPVMGNIYIYTWPQSFSGKRMWGQRTPTFSIRMQCTHCVFIAKLQSRIEGPWVSISLAHLLQRTSCSGGQERRGRRGRMLSGSLGPYLGV